MVNFDNSHRAALASPPQRVSPEPTTKSDDGKRPDFPCCVRSPFTDRPDRCEPRAVKRRPNPYHLLTIPRADTKSRIEAGDILYPHIKY
jgi:hypothetical protein